MATKEKSIFIGSIAFIIFSMLRSLIPVKNMIFYVMACAIFILITLLSYIVLSGRKNSVSSINTKLWSVLPIAVLCTWMVLFYINELKIPQFIMYIYYYIFVVYAIHLYLFHLDNNFYLIIYYHYK